MANCIVTGGDMPGGKRSSEESESYPEAFGVRRAGEGWRRSTTPFHFRELEKGFLGFLFRRGVCTRIESSDAAAWVALCRSTFWRKVLL